MPPTYTHLCDKCDRPLPEWAKTVKFSHLCRGTKEIPPAPVDPLVFWFDR